MTKLPILMVVCTALSGCEAMAQAEQARQH